MYAFISYMHTVVLSFPTFISTAPSSNPFHMPQLHVKFVIDLMKILQEPNKERHKSQIY